MESFKLYQQYAGKFGHTFSERYLSGRAWNAAQMLMRMALTDNGPAVTDEMIRIYMKLAKADYKYL